MIKRICRTLGLAALLAALVAGRGEADSPEPVSLKLSWAHGADFLGFYVAQSRGYYAEEGLAVSIEPLSGPAEIKDVFARVAAGDTDYSAVGLSLIHAQADGLPLTAIANIYKYAPGAFFARADSGIVTPADLRGRRIVVKSKTWQTLLEALLAREGLTLADVEPVSGGFDMTPFLEGEVEVWAGFINDEAVRARQHGLALVTLPLYEYGARGLAMTLFTGRKALKDDPDRAVRFVRASLRGWRWAIDNPSKAVDEMLALYPEMAAERDFHLASFTAAIPLILPPGSRLGEVDCEAWRSHELLAHLQADGEAICTRRVFDAATEK